MVFLLISDTADLRPSIKKNAKSNRKASSENAALKDAALNQQWLSENAALNDELTKAWVTELPEHRLLQKQLTWGHH